MIKASSNGNKHTIEISGQYGEVRYEDAAYRRGRPQDPRQEET